MHMHMQKCHLHSVSPVGGAFTAHKRLSESEDTGFSFVGCKLTGLGVGTSVLGRPWGPYSRVVFALSYMSGTVRPQGWDDSAKQRCMRRPIRASHLVTSFSQMHHRSACPLLCVHTTYRLQLLIFVLHTYVVV